jgi:hypothetical protein
MVVDMGLKSEVRKAAWIRDVEIEVFIPNRTEIFVFDSSAKFLLVKMELNKSTS